MKLYLMPLLFSILCFAGLAQPAEINFREDSVEEIFEAARAEDNLVLIYFAQDHCPPCRRLVEYTFPDSAVVAFTDSHFICKKFNRSLPAERDICTDFGVRGYPTIQILNSKGKLLHKMVGDRLPAAFIAECRLAFDDEHSFAALQAKYKAGNRESDFLYEYSNALRKGGQWDSAVVREYYASLSDSALYEEKNIRYIYKNILFDIKRSAGFGDREYHFMADNRALFEQYFEPDQVLARLLFTLLYQMEEAVKLQDSLKYFSMVELLKELDVPEKVVFRNSSGGISGEWESVDAVINSKWYWYEEMGDTVKAYYYEQQFIEKAWDNAVSLNYLAWGYYEDYDDRPRLLRAKKWAERSIELEPGYANTDTYAAILFKLGEYQAALKQVERAIAYAEEQETDYSETLELKEKILIEINNR